MRRHHHPFGRHGDHHFDDIEAFMHAAGRHERGRGSRFGGDDGFGRGHRGGRFGGGRVFAHGELKLVLLALIAEQPRHGYELIRTIEEMFDGNYAPSPGAVYPTLTMLEEMDYASIEAGDGGKKRYRITDAGRAFLEENKVAVDAAMERMEQTSKLYARMATPVALREAMHNLRHALRGHPWSPAEAKRVVDILKRASREIIDG
ncbi:MAG TPA: PadR family transcriptional regulator, partial [Oleiagrimonas sp.]|nr:PadR family transcriptional regulator [Oleiagrimonas sp.]